MKNIFTGTIIFLSLSVVLSTGVAVAQPDRRVVPLGPMSSINMSGPAAGKITGNAPRMIASTSRYTFFHNGGALIDSVRFIYPSATALKYTQSRSFRYKNGAFLPFYQSTVVYNPVAGTAESSLTQQWDTITGTYVNSGKSVYQNDAKGRIYDAIYQAWDTATGDFINKHHYTDIYNSEGYITDRKEKVWDRNNLSWSNRRHSIYTRNAQNNITSEVLKYWSESAIGDPPIRYEYTYDTSGLILLGYQAFSRDALNEHWQPKSRATYTNNAAGRPVCCVTENWYPVSGKWDTISRITYAYDVPAREMTEVSETYKTIARRFVNSRKVITVYNSFNQLVSKTEFAWMTDRWNMDVPSFQTKCYYETVATPASIVDKAEK